MNSIVCISIFFYNFYTCNGGNVPDTLKTLNHGKTRDALAANDQNIPEPPKILNVAEPKRFDSLPAHEKILPKALSDAVVNGKNIPEALKRLGNVSTNGGTIKTLSDLAASKDIIPKTLMSLNDVAASKENATELEINLNLNVVTAKDLSEAFLNMLKLGGKEVSTRIKELNDKLSRIDSYVLDREDYAQLLLNEAKRNDLNTTNFYNALVQEDRFRLSNDTRNLYLKLKEKMNRDDLLKILSERGGKNVMKSARRMMGDSYIASKRLEMQIDEAVDKYLGEAANDDHSFGEEDPYSHVWDPKLEIEDRLEKRMQGGRRIFKGERTTVRYYPFVVSIHVMGRFWCGGAIYWSDLIITSASCLQLMHNNRFFRENPRALAVRVGSNHSRVGGEVVEALEVYFHPGYNPRTLKCNIAVIRLVRRLRFDHHRIPKVIRLSTNDQGVAFTARVMLLGWGVTKTSQKMAFEPIFLQSKELPVYPSKFCKEVYGEKFVSNTMFCAGTLTTGEGACDHDAGGPAVLAGKLVGIISFGPALCGFPDAPTVFTLIGAYADWIETVNETMPGYYRARSKTSTSTVDPLFDYFASVSRYRPTTETAATIHPKIINAINAVEQEKAMNATINTATKAIGRNGDSSFKLYPVERYGRHKLAKHGKKHRQKETDNDDPSVEQFVDW